MVSPAVYPPLLTSTQTRRRGEGKLCSLSSILQPALGKDIGGKVSPAASLPFPSHHLDKKEVVR